MYLRCARWRTCYIVITTRNWVFSKIINFTTAAGIGIVLSILRPCTVFRGWADWAEVFALASAIPVSIMWRVIGQSVRLGSAGTPHDDYQKKTPSVHSVDQPRHRLGNEIIITQVARIPNDSGEKRCQMRISILSDGWCEAAFDASWEKRRRVCKLFISRD